MASGCLMWRISAPGVDRPGWTTGWFATPPTSWPGSGTSTATPSCPAGNSTPPSWWRDSCPRPGGALDVIAAGGIDGVDSIFALHCEPRLETGRVGTRIGAMTSAADLLELQLTSPGGHTSRPHLTADLVHALGTVITGLPALLS